MDYRLYLEGSLSVLDKICRFGRNSGVTLLCHTSKASQEERCKCQVGPA